MRDSTLIFCFSVRMECSLKAVVDAFAEALHVIDANGVSHKSFKPGVGPYGESDAIRLALQNMRARSPELFSEARTKRLPDVLIPGQWALEFKIIRPFGDNGLPAEHWSENILHPYPGNTSSLGDCMKLLQSCLAGAQRHHRIRIRARTSNCSPRSSNSLIRIAGRANHAGEAHAAGGVPNRGTNPSDSSSAASLRLGGSAGAIGAEVT